MADSKQVVPVSSEWGPGFIDELAPSSQRISLLYHLSYLCLAKFPKLERLLRMRAVETQLLFGSSEAVMLKCVGMSSNLVSSLFPMLVHAVEKKNTTVAVRYLEKARTWINEIIGDVGKIVERYDAHNKDVAGTTSDIITEKKETEKAKSQASSEIKAMQEIVTELETRHKTTTEKLVKNEKKIQDKFQELQNFVHECTKKSTGLGIFAAIVPFIGALVKAIYDAVHSPKDVATVKGLESELNILYSEKTSLKQEEWNLQLQIIDKRMQLSKLQIEQGSIPEPTYLGEVQRYLTQIQKILIDLQKFWENVYSFLGVLKDKTFVGEEILGEPGFEAEFVESIEKAKEAWGSFGCFCSKSVEIFRVQSKDAYNFLETDPDTMSPNQWQKEYDDVKNELEQLSIPKIQG